MDVESEEDYFPPPVLAVPSLTINSSQAPPIDTIEIGSHILIDGEGDDGYEVWLAKVIATYPDEGLIGIYWYDPVVNSKGKLRGYQIDTEKERVC